MANGSKRSMVGRQGLHNIYAGHRVGMFLFTYTPTGVFIFALTAYHS
jgi:hypothetical protein